MIKHLQSPPQYPNTPDIQTKDPGPKTTIDQKYQNEPYHHPFPLPRALIAELVKYLRFSMDTTHAANVGPYDPSNTIVSEPLEPIPPTQLLHRPNVQSGFVANGGLGRFALYPSNQYQTQYPYYQPSAMSLPMPSLQSMPALSTMPSMANMSPMGMQMMQQMPHLPFTNMYQPFPPASYPSVHPPVHPSAPVHPGVAVGHTVHPNYPQTFPYPYSPQYSPQYPVVYAGSRPKSHELIPKPLPSIPMIPASPSTKNSTDWQNDTDYETPKRPKPKQRKTRPKVSKNELVPNKGRKVSHINLACNFCRSHVRFSSTL